MIINPTLKLRATPDLSDVLATNRHAASKEVNCVKVGVIQSFNAATQVAVVEIAFKQILAIAPDGTRTIDNYAPLAHVPVQFPSGGGYTLTFPIAAGDECIVLFNDVELDNWFLAGSGAVPTSDRIHDLSDGIAIVGVRSAPRVLGGVSTSTTQLRNDAGDTYVEIAGGGIVNIVAPTQIVLNSPIVTVTGAINVENTGTVADPFTVTGTILVTGDVVAGSGTTNTSLQHHVHSGVMTGGGNTGQPV